MARWYFVSLIIVIVGIAIPTGTVVVAETTAAVVVPTEWMSRERVTTLEESSPPVVESGTLSQML